MLNIIVWKRNKVSTKVAIYAARTQIYTCRFPFISACHIVADLENYRTQHSGSYSSVISVSMCFIDSFLPFSRG